MAEEGERSDAAAPAPVGPGLVALMVVGEEVRTTQEPEEEEQSSVGRPRRKRKEQQGLEFLWHRERLLQLLVAAGAVVEREYVEQSQALLWAKG